MNKLTTIFLLLGLCSCTRYITVEKPVYLKDSSKQSTTRNYSERENKLSPDSAYVKALVKCDSLGNAYLATIEQMQGERVMQNVVVSEPVRGEISLRIKARDNAREVVKETNTADTVTRYIEKPVEIKVEVPVNNLTGWQWFQIWLARILVVVLIVVNAFKYFKSKFGTLKNLLNAIKKIIN